jgi:hypothetical protein
MGYKVFSALSPIIVWNAVRSPFLSGGGFSLEQHTPQKCSTAFEVPRSPRKPAVALPKASPDLVGRDDAARRDKFYRSNLTPQFFIECLEDLEKSIRSNGAPEPLFGLQPIAPPNEQACANTFRIQDSAGN